MSRSGYSEDYLCDNQWGYICYRGAVASAIRGKRGQAFLREALNALDSLPKPELIPNDLSNGGNFCTLGAVGKSRNIEGLDKIDTYDLDTVTKTFGIPRSLAAEIMYENDMFCVTENPRQRWERMCVSGLCFT